MILGIVTSIFAGLGIYGFFNDSLTLLYIGMGFVIFEHLVGILSGQQRGFSTAWLALFISFGLMISGVYWLEAIAVCLCFEGLICFILGLLMLVIAGTHSAEKNRKENNMKKNIFGKLIVSHEEYADIILSVLTVNEQSFFEDYKDNAIIESNLFSQTLYYVYHIYVCNQILLLKYSNTDSNYIASCALSKILDLQSANIPDNDKEKLKKVMTIYFSRLETDNLQILQNKWDLYQLSKNFLEDLKNSSLDGLMIMKLNILFATFIQYHTSDILNERVILKKI